MILHDGRIGVMMRSCMEKFLRTWKFCVWVEVSTLGSIDEIDSPGSAL